MHILIKRTADQQTLIDAIIAAGGEAFFVGGIVRDTIMKRTSKDIDLEVFRLDWDVIQAVVAACSAVVKSEVTGTRFPVLKAVLKDGSDIDISMPRTERKVSMGDKGFEIVADKDMDKRDAARRRDFSMNAIMVNAATNEVLDFFAGMAAIRNKVLYATSFAFMEDPDRMIRAGRFAAQLDFVVNFTVRDMCNAMADRGEFATIPAEQLKAELVKIFLSPKPSNAFRFFMDAGFGPYMPEVFAMIGVPQDPRWHPEGDVFEHSMRVMDQMVRICDERGIEGDHRVTMVLSALCHDFGKAIPGITIHEEDGSITSRGHADAGIEPARRFMQRMGFATPSMTDKVAKIVEVHMDYNGVSPSARMVRRMAVRMHPVSIAEFCMITEADASGRDMGICKPMIAFEEIAVTECVTDDKPKPIVMGKHCIKAGMKQGIAIGEVLAACYDAQIEGLFDDEIGGWDFMCYVIQERG